MSACRSLRLESKAAQTPGLLSNPYPVAFAGVGVDGDGATVRRGAGAVWEGVRVHTESTSTDGPTKRSSYVRLVSGVLHNDWRG